MKLVSGSFSPVFAAGFLLTTLPMCAQSTNARALLHPRVTGTFERFEKFESKHVAPRYVDVWLPPDYSLPKAKKHRYPVIYVHDGQNLFDPASSFIGVDWGIDETMTRLISEKRIPPGIIVAIWNTPKRLAEYMPQKPLEQSAEADLDEMFKSVRREPLGDAYLRFIVTELKPAIDAHYRTLPDRAHTSLMGSSMGGLISLYAVCEYPDVFGGAACLSTAWQVANGVTVRKLKKSLPDPRTHRLYFDFGTGTMDGKIEPFQDQVDTQLMEAGYVEGKNWLTKKFPGEEHSERAWRKRVHLPLEFLLNQEQTSRTHRAWSKSDSWFHPPLDMSRFRQTAELRDADIMEVASAKTAEAEKQLREVACVELASQRASELVGRPIEPAEGSGLFLVRAVYLNRGTGKFIVVLNGRELLVEHGSLGHSAVPMKRQPLVVRLPRKPEVTYVDCSMDE